MAVQFCPAQVPTVSSLASAQLLLRPFRRLAEFEVTDARRAAASRPPMKGDVVTLYQHIRHPHIAARLADRPVRVSDLFPRGTAVSRFNTRVALLVTRVVGSMWCAYAFALFDLISLPDAIRAGTAAIVSWVAQTFLQLVLLSVIMVGQNVQAAAADKRAEATYDDASAALHELAHVQGHLAAQDEVLTKIAARLGLDPVPVIDSPPDGEGTGTEPAPAPS
jgi:hypothetical protein